MMESKSDHARLDVNIESTEIYTEKIRVKVYCVSDIHADAERNQVWVQEHCVPSSDGDVSSDNSDSSYTVMLVPGDIGSEMDKVERVFRVLANRYDCVCFVPGNHELWRRGSALAAQGSSSDSGGSLPPTPLTSAPSTPPRTPAQTPPQSPYSTPSRMAKDSVQKLREVLELCKKHGVHYGPVTITYQQPHPQDKAMSSPRRLTLFPLFSWYHKDWDEEPALTHPLAVRAEAALPFSKRWGDFAMCSWPAELLAGGLGWQALAQRFGELNEPGIQEILDRRAKPADEHHTLISFSHFVPLQQLTPE
eukprot:gene42836-52341_t